SDAHAQPLEVLHAFGAAGDAGTPGLLMRGSDGNFYGASADGGAANLGTIFRMTPSGAVTILHAFRGGAGDGAAPATARRRWRSSRRRTAHLSARPRRAARRAAA